MLIVGRAEAGHLCRPREGRIEFRQRGLDRPRSPIVMGLTCLTAQAGGQPWPALY